MASPARSPEYEFQLPPSPSATAGKQSASKIIGNLSPPIIAMLAVAGTAFLIVVFARWRRWRRRRRLLRSAASDFGSGSQSPPYPSHFPFSSSSDHLFSPHGLDDAAIKTLPLSLFTRSKAKQPITLNRDCAVCLFEFDDGEWLRTLPICGHGFHIECIDVWLRSHPTCPLCRASVSFRSDSPFVPMRAARIRPSFDDIGVPPADPSSSPIMEGRGRGFVLKRSYSFGFERSVGALERMAMTASPAWRIRRHQQHYNQQQRGFWSKRWPSPFGAMKSPLGRRWGFGALSGGGGAAGGSSAATWMGRAVGFSSSRMRCGDPEALISPERFDRR